MRKWIYAFAGLGLLFPQNLHAQVTLDAIHQCRGIQDSLSRLSCYDSALDAIGSQGDISDNEISTALSGISGLNDPRTIRVSFEVEDCHLHVITESNFGGYSLHLTYINMKEIDSVQRGYAMNPMRQMPGAVEFIAASDNAIYTVDFLRDPDLAQVRMNEDATIPDDFPLDQVRVVRSLTLEHVGHPPEVRAAFDGLLRWLRRCNDRAR
jgi:hypothetical protein